MSDKKSKPKKKKKTQYCEYSHNCDKPYDCMKGEYCPIFKHTSRFSSLKFKEN